MSIVERCPKCGLFTNLRKNEGHCVHCNTDVEAWWEKYNAEMDEKEKQEGAKP